MKVHVRNPIRRRLESAHIPEEKRERRGLIREGVCVCVYVCPLWMGGCLCMYSYCVPT